MTRQLALFAAAALLVCALGVEPRALAQAPSPSQPVVARKSAVTLGPARLSPAPDFTLKSLTGESVKLSDFRGQVVLLNFWASWVGPCKILTPWLVELQSQYGPQGLQVVGVSLDDDATKVEAGEFADAMRVNYPILMGDEKVANAYGGIPAMPVTFFVGRDGKIVDRIIGLKGKGEIEDMIKNTLNPRADNAPSSAIPSPVPQAQK